MREGDRAWGPRPSVGLPPGGRDLVMSARGSASQNDRDHPARAVDSTQVKLADRGLGVHRLVLSSSSKLRCLNRCRVAMQVAELQHRLGVL